MGSDDAENVAGGSGARVCSVDSVSNPCITWLLGVPDTSGSGRLPFTGPASWRFTVRPRSAGTEQHSCSAAPSAWAAGPACRTSTTNGAAPSAVPPAARTYLRRTSRSSDAAPCRLFAPSAASVNAQRRLKRSIAFIFVVPAIESLFLLLSCHTRYIATRLFALEIYRSPRSCCAQWPVSEMMTVLEVGKCCKLLFWSEKFQV